MEDEGRWWRSGDADVVEEESSICVRDKVNGWDPRVMEQGDARVPLATNHLQEGFSAGDGEAVGHEQLLATNCCAARMHTNPSRNICVQRECVVVCARIRGAQAAVGLRLTGFMPPAIMAASKSASVMFCGVCSSSVKNAASSRLDPIMTGTLLL